MGNEQACQDYAGYAFVTRGKIREEILKSLFAPRRPKEIVRELGLHFSVTSKVLNQLSSKGLVESFDKKGKKYFRLTDRGEVIRRVLVS